MSNPGAYYRKRSLDWLRAQGYEAEVVERVMRVIVKQKDGPPRVVFIKRDLFAADIVAMNQTEIIFVNSVLGAKNVAAHLKEFSKHSFPPHVERWVLQWERGARAPEVHEYYEQGNATSQEEIE